MISYLRLFFFHTNASINQRTYLRTSLFSMYRQSFGREVFEDNSGQIQTNPLVV